MSGNGKKSRFTRSGSAGTVVEYYYGGTPVGGIQVQSTGLGMGGAARENDLFIKTDGNVGIGTTDVRGKLQIGSGVGGGNVPSSHELVFGANNSDITFLSDSSGASVDGTIGAWNTVYNFQNSKIEFDKPAANLGQLLFYTNTGSGITERMRIQHDGKVGIGTTSPGDYYAKDLVVGAADEGLSLIHI